MKKLLAILMLLLTLASCSTKSDSYFDDNRTPVQKYMYYVNEELKFLSDQSRQDFILKQNLIDETNSRKISELVINGPVTCFMYHWQTYCFVNGTQLTSKTPEPSTAWWYRY